MRIKLVFLWDCESVYPDDVNSIHTLGSEGLSPIIHKEGSNLQKGTCKPWWSNTQTATVHQTSLPQTPPSVHCGNYACCTMTQVTLKRELSRVSPSSVSSRPRWFSHSELCAEKCLLNLNNIKYCFLVRCYLQKIFSFWSSSSSNLLLGRHRQQQTL